MIASAISTLLEIDEVSVEPLPDGRCKVTFLTTGVVDNLVKLKSMIWALLSPPVQRVEDVNITVVSKGPISKRYRVEVILRPLIGGGLRSRLGS